jgi:hypothetical protein
MGGYGSGRQEETAKTDVALRLSVTELQRQGSLTPGRHVITWRRTGGREASISLEAREADLVLSFTSQTGAKAQRVWLEYTANNYGERRPWFRCPRCARRVGVLYFRQGEFMCRPCSGLKYRSQSEGYADRMRRRARKIRDRLGADHALRVLASRPKGMHWATFFRLEEELADIESMVLQHELDETIRSFGLRI